MGKFRAPALEHSGSEIQLWVPALREMRSKTFSQKSHLEEYIYIHTNEKTFVKCSKTFSYRINLDVHFRIHMDINHLSVMYVLRDLSALVI